MNGAPAVPVRSAAEYWIVRFREGFAQVARRPTVCRDGMCVGAGGHPLRMGGVYFQAG